MAMKPDEIARLKKWIEAQPWWSELRPALLDDRPQAGEHSDITIRDIEATVQFYYPKEVEQQIDEVWAGWVEEALLDPSRYTDNLIAKSLSVKVNREITSNVFDTDNNKRGNYAIMNITGHPNEVFKAVERLMAGGAEIWWRDDPANRR